MESLGMKLVKGVVKRLTSTELKLEASVVDNDGDATEAPVIRPLEGVTLKVTDGVLGVVAAPSDGLTGCIDMSPVATVPLRTGMPNVGKNLLIDLK